MDGSQEKSEMSGNISVQTVNKNMTGKMTQDNQRCSHRDWIMLTDSRLGDPLADIEEWMLPTCPVRLRNGAREGQETTTKSEGDGKKWPYSTS